MHSSFLSYRGKYYLYLALIISALAILVYGWHSPLETPNGGTWLGYTLGTIAALLIVWLLFFGVRKRSYRSNLGTVQGWLSAHVYLGTALLIIASLHCGFQFGGNIHTVAYGLMVAVVVSGFFGVYGYARYPKLMADVQLGQTREELFMTIADLDNQLLRLANRVDSETSALIGSAIERTEIGGSLWQQLLGTDLSKVMIARADSTAATRLTANPDQQAVVKALNERIAQGRGGENALHLQELLSLLSRKRALLRKARQALRLQILMQLWLYVHVPLSFALLGALLAHIFSVFVYW